jgi:hypothetical protein
MSNSSNSSTNNNTTQENAVMGELDGIIQKPVSNRVYVKPGDLSKGSLIKGTYKESFTGGQFNTTTHILLADGGKEVAINGCSDLDDKFSRIPGGSQVTVKYNGKKEFKTKRGMASSHEFWVEMSADGVNFTPVKKLSREAREAAEGNNSFRS